MTSDNAPDGHATMTSTTQRDDASTLSDDMLAWVEDVLDATIIAAPPSTKNKSRARDPEMHQTKKGNEWHFGMKAHIGADVASGVVHTLTGTAANEADINQTAALLHGDPTLLNALPQKLADVTGAQVASAAASIRAQPRSLLVLAPGAGKGEGA